MKFKNWNGKSLKGDWMFTIKIDGIQGRKVTFGFANSNIGAKSSGFYVVSKNDKQLNNLPKTFPSGQIFEIFNGSCNSTWSILSGPEGERERIKNKQIYKLFPVIDNRLILAKKITNPTARQIKSWFTKVRLEGYEGLVLRPLETNKNVTVHKLSKHFIKVKASYTVDTKIIGFVEGKGRLKGMLGKFVTENGGVGVGFTDAMRKEFWNKKEQLLNTTIEVKCMEITKNNRFRQPRFVKLRPDK